VGGGVTLASVMTLAQRKVSSHASVACANVAWVSIAYLVVIAATLLTFGRVSDLIGRKSVWVPPLVLFHAEFPAPIAPVQQGMLVAGILSALQPTFLRNSRVALPARAVFAAKGIGTTLVRGREPSPGARFKPENVLRVVE
jgi:MFS family permease